jgi:hypothetical protein
MAPHRRLAWQARRGAAVAMAAGLLLAPVQGRQQSGAAADGPDPRLQVAVPEGRNDAGQRGGAPPQGRGGRGGRSSEPPRPAPRNAHGRALLDGGSPGATGVWVPRGVAPNPLGLEDTPFRPWALALLEDRRSNELEPHTRCKPSGTVRQFLTPYGVEIVELPELDRVYLFDIGGPHTYRTVDLDGRTHPTDIDPTYYGHSIGWWEGDTLVVDTVGFNEGFWLDREGRPHTSQLHTLERLTRTDLSTLRYELTVDDPGAYTAPFTGAMNLRWEAGTELFEYVCQQANYAHELMVGDFESVTRTTVTVP